MEYPLFDTVTYSERFGRIAKASWDVKKLLFSQDPRTTSRHIFIPVANAKNKRKLDVRSAVSDEIVQDEYEVKVQAAMEEQNPIMLHIGGQVSV